jgi:hypothetical protein
VPSIIPPQQTCRSPTLYGALVGGLGRIGGLDSSGGWGGGGNGRNGGGALMHSEGGRA